MAEVTWTMKLYDALGAQVTSTSYDTTLAASNTIRHAFARSITFTLNGIDECEFQLYLDDPIAPFIRRGDSVVKIYRDINDTINAKTLVSTASEPSFVGVVAHTTKNGEENTMRIKCFSALWRLQTKFHLLNHLLEINPDTSDNYTQSELMWKLIDLTNGAFGGDSFIGISEGNFLWGAEPEIGTYFVPKGSNTWSNIFDDLMNRPASPDIIPRYFHQNNVRRQMYFDTDQKRGSDISSTMKFNYHTTSPSSNCDNMTEEEQILPYEFANYLWVVGSGGPNSGKISARANSSATSGSDGYGEIGVYMARVDRDEVKRVSALSPIAEAEQDKRAHPIPSYNVTISPVAGIYYDIDFTLGDVVALNANRGALAVTNKKQRIFHVQLTMSENNVETVDVLLSKDFYGKVET